MASSLHLSRLSLAVIIAATLTTGLGAGWLLPRDSSPAHVHAEATAAVEHYQCPMHPAVVQDEPGTCPICGMKLVRVAASPPKATARTPLFYRNPMDARQTSPVPMKDQMGMDYLPVYAQPERSEVEGLGVVHLDATSQRRIGLTTGVADRGVVGGSVRTVARVSVDETRVRRVNVKVPGFIEKLYVDFVGKPVRRGQPLFSLYSPELLTAEDELLLALAARGPTDPLAVAARKKLELWGVPEAELARLERERTSSSVVTFVSTVSGVVTKKEVVEGSRVELGAMPFEVTDLSTVWVLADLYEAELRFIAPGQPATLRLDAWPGRTWEGTVRFIDPVMDAQTRTAKVRLAFANPRGELRPEMFGDVTLMRAPRQTLRVPTDAVVLSGTRAVVFVAHGDGRFEPRAIETGEASREFTEVLSGLTEGEAVTTRANFLVDSESKLRASLAALTPRKEPPR